jgi:hypothetical protein
MKKLNKSKLLTIWPLGRTYLQMYEQHKHSKQRFIHGNIPTHPNMLFHFHVQVLTESQK